MNSSSTKRTKRILFSCIGRKRKRAPLNKEHDDVIGWWKRRENKRSSSIHCCFFIIRSIFIVDWSNSEEKEIAVEFTIRVSNEILHEIICSFIRHFQDHEFESTSTATNTQSTSITGCFLGENIPRSFKKMLAKYSFFTTGKLFSASITTDIDSDTIHQKITQRKSST